MIRWSYSQWWVCVASVLALFGGLTVEARVAWGVWPAWAALAGFWLTCGGWSGIAVLVHGTRHTRSLTTIHRHRRGSTSAERSESRIHKMGA